jgi:hypothetical protein
MSTEDPISQIVISRPQSEHPSLRRIDLVIDGVTSARLARHEQAVVSVTPGEHIALASAGRLRSPALSLDTKAGERIFLTVRCEPGGGRSMATNWVVLNLMRSAADPLGGGEPLIPGESERAETRRGLRPLLSMSLVLAALFGVLIWAIASRKTVIGLIAGVIAICVLLWIVFVIPGRRLRRRAD